MKLLQLIEDTTRYFAKNGVDAPRLTIELILAEVLQKKRMELYLNFDLELPEETLQKLRPLVKKRTEGFPLQQVLGVAEFSGRRFKITADVLCPRPETELLLEEVVRRVEPGKGMLVDVGTGSGILAVSLAVRFPSESVLGIDVSPAALEVARDNGAGLPNLSWLQSDLLKEWVGQAQIMVANLPYIPTEQIPLLGREVQKDPRLALDGGSNGVELIERLIEESRGRTRFLALEFGDGQKNRICELLHHQGYEMVFCGKDYTERERYLIGEYRG